MDINNLYEQKVYILKLPYWGDDGIDLIKSNETSTWKTLRDSYDVRIISTDTKI